MSKSELVYHELRTQILAGDLAPGEMINKQDVGERLGASRQPVSAAIERLAFEGLIDIAPQHGSFVAGLGLERLSDWLLVRAALESEFSARFAEYADEAEIAELQRNLQYQKMAMESRDGTGFYDLDRAFHQIINQQSEPGEGHKVLTQARTHLERLHRLLLPAPENPMRTVMEHQKIVDAIAARDVAAAAQAARLHIRRIEQRIRVFIADNPDLGRATQKSW